MRLNAGTVPHLHYNTFEPDPGEIQLMTDQMTKQDRATDKKIEVRIPVYKDPGDRVGNQERAAEFSARYETGEVPE